MSTALKFAKDANGFNTGAPRPSTAMKNVSLSTGTAASFTVPSETDVTHYTVYFKYQPNSAVWVDVTGATAAIPAGNTILDTTSQMNPDGLLLPAGTVVSMISSNNNSGVSIVMFQGGSY